jgi:2-polyprenyl-3-methyl-5-hydroxy-6-metoxy-1,4-benzoquinol methylase
MAIDDQIRWDRQHAEGRGTTVPSRFVQEILDSDHWTILPGRALDVATGKGRNALFLASRGFQVTAIDISTVGLEEGRTRARDHSLSIDWEQADLENLQLAAAAYDLIVNINYLQRSLLPGLRGALKPGGHMIFETYLIDQQAAGHPRNPDYLLHHNELLDHFRDYRVLLYREGRFADGAEPSFRAGIFARKSAEPAG